MSGNIGKLIWFDLTVPDTEKVRDFYAQGVGWKPQDHDMGDYNDYDMLQPDTDVVVTGICHPTGMNAHIPPQWMLYVTVDNLDNSLAKCRALGGEVIGETLSLGSNRMCIIKDPAGAFMTLSEDVSLDGNGD